MCQVAILQKKHINRFRYNLQGKSEVIQEVFVPDYHRDPGYLKLF